MNRLYEIFKTPSGPSTGKALLNHTIFSTSQTGETVPLSMLFMGSEYSMLTAVRYYRLYRAITSARVAVEAQ
jgi:hypothetical protein